MNTQEITESRVYERIARFMYAQGIPYDAIEQGPLRDLLISLNPTFRLPDARLLEQHTECMRLRHAPALPHGMRALSVTYDVFGGPDDDKFLAFSVHCQVQHFRRSDLIYFRRIEGAKISTKTILDTIRAVVRSEMNTVVKVTQIVTPNETLAQFSQETSSFKQITCFYHYISLFADKILRMEQFATKIAQFRELIKTIRGEPELVAIFTRVDPSLGTYRNLPVVDKGGWQSTAKFLWDCLPMYQELIEFAENYSLKFDVSFDAFIELKFFYTILEYLGESAKTISKSGSSISQVIPTIMRMRRLIFNHTKNSQFKDDIRLLFANVFKKVTSGEHRPMLDMATLLDPRFGYRKDLYSDVVWRDIEKKLVAKMHSLGQVGTSCGISMKSLELQIKKYRHICLTSRPNEDDDPMDWWHQNGPQCLRVASTAHELFVTPAVSIDASFFFGVGGKFNHLLREQSEKQARVSLEMAGYEQEFRGRGLNCFEQSSADQVDWAVPVKKIFSAPPPKRQKLSSELISEQLLLAEPSNPPEKKPLLTLFSACVKEEDDAFDQPGCSSFVKQEEPEHEFVGGATLETMLSMSYDDSDLLSECWDNKSAQNTAAEGMTPEMSHSVVMNQRSSRADRRHYCVLCGQRQQALYIRHVKTDSEKLFLCTGAVHLNSIELDEARDFYRRNQIVVCRTHFVDFSHAFFAHLKVNGFEDIRYAHVNLMGTLMKIAMDIAQHHIDQFDFRHLLCNFTKKNYNLPDRRAFRSTDIKTISNALEADIQQQLASEAKADAVFEIQEVEESIFE